MMEAEVKAMGLLEGCYEPSNVGSLWKLEKAGKQTPRLEPPDGAQPCQHLVLNPVRPCQPLT